MTGYSYGFESTIAHECQLALKRMDRATAVAFYKAGRALAPHFGYTEDEVDGIARENYENRENMDLSRQDVSCRTAMRLIALHFAPRLDDAVAYVNAALGR